MSETADTPSPIPVRTAAFAAGLGAWVLWSGIVLTGTGLIIINNVIVGGLIAFFAAYTAGWPDGGRLPAIAAPALVVLFGLWTVVAPFVFGVAIERLLWSNVVSGVLVVLLAVGSVYGSWQLTQSATSV
ncbi:SPW repeat domain-containing protein [Natronorubrum sulfidifaciens]|uniref:SPW repeat-containing protein n=1 Tax=Natronorubrum sulfidifaciens JCM 14089 TaxID=1230460 RepID=L9VZB9_9EURY|nr:SPW repeat protein [Natronorubrum sulfidifaciens]ELY42549.1 SPW repeat-containing protein [Natronorubrum sulfidifaciens JCM 14089]